MYKVKVTSITRSNLIRQTPGGSGIFNCGRYQFLFDEEVKDPDFWVVRNKYVKSKMTCEVAPENTILMVSEPRSVVNIPKRYRDQFGMLCVCQEGVKHKNVFYTNAILPWFIGSLKSNGEYSQTYDSLKNSGLPIKTKLISVITSNKAFTKGHQDRISFVEKLKAHYGDAIDVFGRGINDFKDKWDVLAPYKYHIAIENSSSKYYWTEKISDCYLTGTYPIYYGCTNIGDYFPENSYKVIDIYNFEKAVAIIDEIIKNDEFGKNLSVLNKCKELVLDDYNMFNIIAKYCDMLNPDLPKQKTTLKPAITVLDWHNFYLYFIERNFFVLKRLLRLLFHRNSNLKMYYTLSKL